MPGNAQPLLQVPTDMIDVSEMLCVQSEELAVVLTPGAASRFGCSVGSKPASAGSNGNPISILHAPPLRAPWHAALAAALQTMLLWLDHLPGGTNIADKLFALAMRLTGPAADGVSTAADGADRAAALEQPAAIALAEALLAYLDMPVRHVRSALQPGGTRRPDFATFAMGTHRTVAFVLKAMAVAVVSPLREASWWHRRNEHTSSPFGIP